MSASDFSTPPGSEPTSISISLSPKFTPALIVIDMQNDFVYGSLAVPGAPSIINIINKIIDMPQFKVRIATKDFHPNNHVSFANTHKKEVFSTQMIYHPDDKEQQHGIEQTMWPSHCVANSGGADFVPGLITNKFNKVVHKGTHPNIESYSAFRDIWRRGMTDLADILDVNGVTDVFFVGLAGDYCVKYTALDAAEFSYKTWVVSDAVKSISNDKLAQQEMEKKGVKFLTAEELIFKLQNETE